jgi:NADPH:quinone reductase-like Zn-dependent oxidoreductase
MLTGFGGPEMLTLERAEDRPEPGPGEARVRILVTSAAFTDVMIRRGMYPELRQKPPFVPGYDMVGIVDALGPGVDGPPPGTRVADLSTTGAYSEYLCRPVADLVSVPAGVADTDALAMVLSGTTAWQMLHRIARLGTGQSLLVHGAGGAVGTAMLQLARRAGITAYGSDVPAKHDLVRDLGGTPVAADAAAEEVARIVGDGVDAVFDPLGGESLSRSLHALRPGGMLVAFGFTNEVLGRGGSIPRDIVRLKLWDWLPNGHATAFYSIGSTRRRHPDWFREDLATLFGLLASGELAPAVAEVVPLADVRQAHARVEAGDVAGKLILRVTDA